MALSSFYDHHKAEHPFIEQLVHVITADLVLQGVKVNGMHDCTHLCWN